MRCRLRGEAACLLCAVVALLASCDAWSEPPRTLTRDSSGVQIVENLDTAPDWSVQHQLTIGVLSGDLPYQLDHVPDATMLPDGRIVVVNGGSGDLRFFAADGTHLQTVGQSGSGPGEFRAPASIYRRGDTLVVWDFPRTTLVNTSGELIGTHEAERMRIALTLQRHGTPLGVDRLETGSFIMRVSPSSDTRDAGADRAKIGVVWMSDDLQESHLIGIFPDVRQINVGTPTQPMALPVPMSAHVLYATGSEPLHVYVAWSDAFEVLVHSRDGQLQRIVRKAHSAVPVTEDALAAVHEQWRSSLAQSLPEDEVERRLDLMPDPDHYPALDALFVDERGWLWARDYLRPSDTATHFSVFDTTGTLRGKVEIPTRFEPFEATADYVLGVSRDEVERVELYAIER